jgi:hypothetical protein
MANSFVGSTRVLKQIVKQMLSVTESAVQSVPNGQN